MIEEFNTLTTLKPDYERPLQIADDGRVVRQNWKMFFHILDPICKEWVDQRASTATRITGDGFGGMNLLAGLVEQIANAPAEEQAKIIPAFQALLPDVYDAYKTSLLGFSEYHNWQRLLAFAHAHLTRFNFSMQFEQNEAGYKLFLDTPLFHEILRPWCNDGKSFNASQLNTLTIGDVLYNDSLFCDVLAGRRLMRVLLRDCYPAVVNALYEQDENGCVMWESELSCLESEADIDMGPIRLGWGGCGGHDSNGHYLLADIRRHLEQYFNVTRANELAPAP